MNIELKPWEQTRDVPGGSHEPEWIERSRTHVGKSMLGPALNDLLLFDGDHRTVAVASVGISAGKLRFKGLYFSLFLFFSVLLLSCSMWSGALGLQL